MSVFDKLAAIKQVSFKDGEITLFNERVAVIPQEFAIFLTKEIIQNPILIPKYYEGLRKGVYAGWANNIRATYHFDQSPRKFVDWLIELGAFVGWGKHELVRFNSEKLEGVLRTHNGPMAIHFKNQYDKPIDHLWRALTAGSSSAAFQTDMDWVELSCMSQGKPYCEFLFKPRKAWTKEELMKYKDQLP